MSVQVAEFVDLRDGTTGGQFTIGDRKKIKSISDLDPMYRRLMDEAIPVTIAVMGNIGRPNLTPIARGAEIGFTHGYFLVGPFYAFGPLRTAEFSTVSLSAMGFSSPKY